MTMVDVPIAIIGAGFAGLGMATRLLAAGRRDFVVLERASSVGGTWRDNTYPGVACDVPAHLYSYSFELNPGWTQPYARQHEIHAYLEHCAAKYGVHPHLRFNTGVRDASYHEPSATWTLTLDDGETLRCRVLISCAGHGLSVPALPDLPGRDAFAGTAMHSARWDHSVPLAGKRVAVIGSGASAIQLVPAIVPEVAALTLFQRTAGWVQPKLNGGISPRARALFARRPGVQRTLRRTLYAITELMALGLLYEDKVPPLRALGAVRQWRSKRHLGRAVADPALRAKLTPGYRIGCKRVLFSNDYYPALTRDHVDVVTSGIAEVRPHSIVTGDGVEVPVDVLIYATGFEAAEARPRFAVHGKHGQTLTELWADGAEAYYGMSVAGLPNLFFVIGPNSGLGHTSMIVMMEAQIGYILDALRLMEDRNLRSMEVRPEAQRKHNAWLQERLGKTVWSTGGCQSWYRTADGKNTTLWPGLTMEYRMRVRRFHAESYVLVEQPVTVAGDEQAEARAGAA
jgi:cation diffusion facilitator CzcD-associated flavoprotein CzcO